MRKMISFKIENLPAKEQAIVDAWADGQKNINQSLANLVMHVVAWTGNADVMDFEVQQKLHSVLNNIEAPTQTVQTINTDEGKNVPREEITKLAANESEELKKTTDAISKATALFED